MALTDKLTAIGDAIRTKTGGTDLLTLDQMATEIANIQGGGGGGERGALKSMLADVPFNSYNGKLIINIPNDFQLPCFVSISASSSSKQHGNLTYSTNAMRYNFFMLDYKDGENTYDNIEATLLNCKVEDGGISTSVPYYTGIGTISYDASNRQITIYSAGTEYFAGAGKLTDAKAKVYYWPKQ